MFHLYKAIKQFIRSKRHRLSRHIYAESMLKKRGLLFRKNDIEIIGIGSSHCARGFDTDRIKNAFNLGIVDQDLYTTHWLFDHYLKDLPHLKKVILFYSIHSQGYEICKTKAFQNTAISHYIFDVPYPVDYLKKWKRGANHRLKKFNDSDIDYATFSGYVPEEPNPNFTQPTAEFRCAHHLRENARPTKQNFHIFEIAEYCLKNNIQFYIVIPPYRADYLKVLAQSVPDTNDLFQDVLTYAKENNIPVLNELGASSYTATDFADSDHLNIPGAKKLTKKVAHFIGEPFIDG